MRIAFKLFAPVALAFLVSGCQQLDGGWSPYEYRYADNAVREVCVSVTPADNQSLWLTVQQVLTEEGFVVREMKAAEERCPRSLKFDFQTGGWSNRVVAGNLDYIRLMQGNRYEAVAREKLPEAGFGVPDDDQKLLVRSLVTRIFPQPVPWKSKP